jgi:DNA-binding response OmpR family regulator
VIRIKSKYQKEDALLTLQDICYNPTTRLLKKGSQTLGLGEVQQNLFHTLITEQNKIVDSYRLMDFLEQPSANALRVNLTKLKNKLGIEIKNIRAQGYMIEDI